MGAGLDGGVLGRKAEGVEADRAQDALALHGLVADGQVAEGVVPDVPLVRRPGGIGVHAQRVELLPGIVVIDLVGALVVPVALPFALHRIDVVRACHGTRVGDTPVPSGQRRRRFSGRGSPFRGCPGPRSETGRVSSTASVGVHHWGRSSAGRAPDWQSGGSWVQVPSPPQNFRSLSVSGTREPFRLSPTGPSRWPGDRARGDGSQRHRRRMPGRRDRHEEEHPPPLVLLRPRGGAAWSTGTKGRASMADLRTGSPPAGENPLGNDGCL